MDNNYSNTDAYMDETPERKLADIILLAIKKKSGSIYYYKGLVESALPGTDGEILRQIMLDEIKHKKMVDNIYTKLTENEAKYEIEKKKAGMDFISELGSSVLDELENAEFYRNIYLMFSNAAIRDMLFEIITDEQCHAAKLTFLYSKNMPARHACIDI